ncbi:AAEL008520-PA [Aedes aegypti]|uniref:AAEL008520-PA n=1 Tax=Aedes aegypti TaxID=7159 RepID=Q16YG2_AEDAE|nr:AAEL008520-PA [Aedes aegypti]
MWVKKGSVAEVLERGGGRSKKFVEPRVTVGEGLSCQVNEGAIDLSFMKIEQLDRSGDEDKIQSSHVKCPSESSGV